MATGGEMSTEDDPGGVVLDADAASTTSRGASHGVHGVVTPGEATPGEQVPPSDTSSSLHALWVRFGSDFVAETLIAVAGALNHALL